MSSQAAIPSVEEVELSVQTDTNLEEESSQRTLFQLSTIEREAAQSTDFQAVIICIACFTVVFTACGTNFAFGVYQELYEQFSKQSDTPFTGASSAAIDLIGTLAVSFMTIGAPFASAWTRQSSPRIVIGAGGLLFGISCILASFSTKLWEFELSQGLLMGVATCLAYVPAVTVAPTWYGPRRGLAMGIILAGTGVGGLVWAPAITALITRVGFRNSLRISGSISAAAIIIAATVTSWDPITQARLDSENSRQHLPWYRSIWSIPLVNWRIAKTRKFAVHFIGTSLQSAAYYTPVFFFATYARTLGYSTTTGANFIAINNACNAIGKIVIGMVADRYGSVNTLFVVTLFSSVATFGFWLPSNFCQSLMASRGLFITYSITYGIFASPYVSLFPSSIVELFGPANFASVNGVLYMARGLATLVGTPTAGVLIQSSMEPNSYWRLTIMVAALLATASAALLWLKVDEKQRRRLSSL